MSTADDAFAAFLERLATALQDRALDAPTAADVAVGIGFSRFHFDRIVTAVAGESPSALRRRILLERAAFRMMSTSAPLLEIAVEAGYGSNAAFTRAFTRAFEETPSVWRRHPSQFRIAAASDGHFHPPGSILLPSREQVTDMDLLERMVEHHIWRTGEMIRVAGGLSPAELDQPIDVDVDEDPQSIRSLLARLVGQLAMWNAVMAGRDYDMSAEDGESVSSLREKIAIEGPRYLEHVRTVIAEGRLDETFVHAGAVPVEVISYGGNIAHILTFAAYRRTLVLLALAAHGRDELGWGDPRHWVVGP